MHRHTNERGIALVLSILALVFVGALISGVFAAAMFEQRVGENSRRMGQAQAVAEHGLSETVAFWNTATWNGLAVGDTALVGGSAPQGTGTFSGTIRRLNQELFLVDITGNDSRAGARQRLGAFIKIRVLDIDIEAALTSAGPTRIGGSAQIDGTDRNPPSWSSCPMAGAATSGIRTEDRDDLSFLGGCSGASCVTGDPKILEDETIDESTFFEYGDLDWAALTAMATKVMPPATYRIEPTIADGECDIGSPENWGDPFGASSPCFEYFPIIYVPGNLTLNGKHGQGLLLVEGDLEVQGGLLFYGIVIVKGRLKTLGTGGHFTGGVMAANVDLDQNNVLGDAIINYSNCAVLRAVANASPGAMLRSRAWLQLY